MLIWAFSIKIGGTLGKQKLVSFKIKVDRI